MLYTKLKNWTVKVCERDTPLTRTHAYTPWCVNGGSLHSAYWGCAPLSCVLSCELPGVLQGVLPLSCVLPCDFRALTTLFPP